MECHCRQNIEQEYGYKEKREIIEIINRLHGHNKTIRETFYAEKSNMLKYIDELKTRNLFLEEELQHSKIIQGENTSLSCEIRLLKKKIMNFESQINQILKDKYTKEKYNKDFNKKSTNYEEVKSAENKLVIQEPLRHYNQDLDYSDIVLKTKQILKPNMSINFPTEYNKPPAVVNEKNKELQNDMRKLETEIQDNTKLLKDFEIEKLKNGKNITEYRTNKKSFDEKSLVNLIKKQTDLLQILKQKYNKKQL